MKKGKNIIALVLSFLMLFPSLSISALEFNNIGEESASKSEWVLDNKHSEESIDSNLENTEDKGIVNEEVNNTQVIADEFKEYNNYPGENDNLVGEFYKKIEKPLIYSAKNNIVFDREEYNLKAKALSRKTYLEPKTDDNYEVALSYLDGNYSFVDSTNDYDEALNIVDNIDKQEGLVDVIPVVINNYGNLIYSTNSIARIVKYIDGQEDVTMNFNTNIYADAELTQNIGYINHGSVEDAPILEQREKSTLIQVGGIKAWINSDFNSRNYDIEVYPLTDVHNLSYYKVSGGILYHFLSSDLRENYEYGTTLTVGQAPEYLKEGIKYYSYDGHYFYRDLNQLITDLKGNNNNNSVNSGNPFYNYYQYLPFRTTTTYTANELNSFINARTSTDSKLRGTGEAFINAQNEYGVNALLALGLAINESNWGKSKIAKEKNNLFGLNAVDEDAYDAAFGYYSVEAGIKDFAKNWISGYWADPLASSDVYQGKYGRVYNGGHLGDKLNGANVTYASDPYWGEKAAQWAFVIDNSLGRTDVNLYQLSMFISNEDIYGEDGTYLYTAKAGHPIALISSEVNRLYQIHPDRTMSISTMEWMTDYNWSYRAKISSANIKLINSRKNETQLSKGISYQTHLQEYGWQGWKNNGEMSGTSGEAKRLEGIKIMLDNTIQGARISYQTHIQDYGWQDWKKDGQMSGTSGQSKRLEAIRIKLENAPGYKVEYRVHVQDYGWQDWKSDGEIAGTSGESKRLEAIEIRIVKEQIPNVEYRTHVENYGWQDFKKNGEMSGTTGEAKRLEGIELKLTDSPQGFNIVYQTHVEDYGWQGWKKNGEMAGTSGQAKRLESIRIKLENVPGYKVEYRVHVEDYGWQEWKSDGEIAGTTGEAKRLEGIEVRIVKK